jgi:hypothetical protein
MVFGERSEHRRGKATKNWIGEVRRNRVRMALLAPPIQTNCFRRLGAHALSDLRHLAEELSSCVDHLFSLLQEITILGA